MSMLYTYSRNFSAAKNECIVEGRGGATVLKVKGTKVCERSKQKIFLTPTFWPVGDKILLR